MSGVVASVSPSRAGAHRVTLRLALRTYVQCGRLRGGSLVVTLPAAMGAPAAIGRTAVTVSNGHPASVVVSHHRVTLALEPPRGIVCDSMGPGAVTIDFAPAAGLSNPRAAGRYRVTVARKAETASGVFAVR